MSYFSRLVYDNDLWSRSLTIIASHSMKLKKIDSMRFNEAWHRKQCRKSVSTKVTHVWGIYSHVWFALLYSKDFNSFWKGGGGEWEGGEVVRRRGGKEWELSKRNFRLYYCKIANCNLFCMQIIAHCIYNFFFIGER